MGVVNVGSALGGLAGGAATARLLVVISGQSAGLTTALSQASGSLKNFSKNSNAIGNALIRGVTLPTLALGGAALKMAADYETAMARVAGLTTLSADEVVDADRRILEMAKRVPTAPTELANALYFAGSAGLDYSEAMQVVEKSSQAAAIGMGSAEDMAKVLIFSMNAYESEGLTAARAMDVFTGAIKEGTASPDELALALGRVLPVAKKVGVSFDTTVASIAALTNMGLPTRVAATSMRALLGGLLAPTIQATEALKELGITTEQLRTAVDAGPIVAFKMLEEAVGGNDDMLRKIIPQIRAFTAYLGLGDDNLERTAKLFDRVRNSTGAFDKAVAKVADTTQFKFALALNNLKIAGIEMGRVLFPVFERIISGVTDLGEAFQSMGPGLKQVVAAFLLLAAAGGPLVKMYSILTASGIGLFSTFRATSMALGVMAASAIIGTNAFKTMAGGSASLVTALTLAASAFLGITLALRGLSMLAASGLLRTSKLAQGLAGLSRGTIGTAAALGTLAAVGIAVIVNKMNEAENAARRVGDAFESLGGGAAISKSSLAQLDNTLTGMELQVFEQAARDAGVWGKQLGSNLKTLRTQVQTTLADLESDYDPGIFGIGFEAESDLQVKALRAQDIALGESAEVFKSQTEDKISLFGREKLAAQALAKEYGISLGYAEQTLGSMGVAAAELDEDTKASFASQAGWVDEKTGQMKAALQEQRKIEAKIVEERQSQLRGDVLGKFFEGQVESINKSTAALVSNTTKQTAAAVAMARNVSQLRMRGLDPGALQFLVDQGPAMVGKFVDASDGELKRLEQNYYTTLGAIDAAILNEGKHEEVKGRNMVRQFAQGMLSNKALPPAVASEIVGRVTEALTTGKINRAGVEIVTKIADRMEAVKNLPKEAAGKIAMGITNALINGNYKAAGGKGMQKLASGIVENSGIPKKAIGEVKAAILGVLRAASVDTKKLGGATLQQLTGGIDSKIPAVKGASERAASGVKKPISVLPGFARSVGTNLGSSLAQGITNSTPNAVAAATEMARQVKNATDKAHKGSPRYFTYYLGRNLVKQLGEGVASATPRSVPRPGFHLPTGSSLSSTRSSESSRGIGKVEQHFHGDGYVDPKKAVRELDWYERTRS